MTTPAPARPDVAHRVFSDGRLSIGLTLPLLRTGHIVADFDEQLELAALADALGFRALWIRDVPLNSADYPDPVGHLDPWVLLGAWRHARAGSRSPAARSCCRCVIRCISRKARCRSRHCRAAASFSAGSGDRPPEYAAFGVDAETRRDRYRAHWDVVAAALGVPSRVVPDEAPPDAPEFTLLPRGRRRADAGGRLGRTKCRLDRAALARLDDVPPRSGHAARTLFDVARGGRPARDARLSRVRRIDAARPRRGSRCAGHRIAARLCNRTPRIDRHPAGHARRGHAPRHAESAGPARARSHRGNRGTRSAGFHDGA